MTLPPCLSRDSTHRFLQWLPCPFRRSHYWDVSIICPNFHWRLLCTLNLLCTCWIYVMHLLNLCVFYTVFIAKTSGSFQWLKTHRKKEYVFLQWKTSTGLNKFINRNSQLFSVPFFPNLICHYLTSPRVHFCHPFMNISCFVPIPSFLGAANAELIDHRKVARTCLWVYNMCACVHVCASCPHRSEGKINNHN